MVIVICLVMMICNFLVVGFLIVMVNIIMEFFVGVYLGRNFKFFYEVVVKVVYFFIICVFM